MAWYRRRPAKFAAAIITFRRLPRQINPVAREYSVTAQRALQAITASTA